MAARRGALVLQIGQERRFVPASVALRVARSPRITAVPGGPVNLLGISVVEGTVVPVIAVGDAREHMIVCQHAGELVGIVGGHLVQTGTFDVAAGQPERLEIAGAVVCALDVGELYARVQDGARSGRWG